MNVAWSRWPYLLCSLRIAPLKFSKFDPKWWIFDGILKIAHSIGTSGPSRIDILKVETPLHRSRHCLPENLRPVSVTGPDRTGHMTSYKHEKMNFLRIEIWLHRWVWGASGMLMASPASLRDFYFMVRSTLFDFWHFDLGRVRAYMPSTPPKFEYLRISHSMK